MFRNFFPIMVALCDGCGEHREAFAPDDDISVSGYKARLKREGWTFIKREQNSDKLLCKRCSDG